MKKIIIATLFSLIVILVALITGCRKDTTLVLNDAPKTITDTVSFTKVLIPIFSKNCALSSCHASGGHAPDLSADKAYSSLTNASNFIDLKTPENSIIYKRLTGALSPAMPMGRTTNPDDINDLVL